MNDVQKMVEQEQEPMKTIPRPSTPPSFQYGGHSAPARTPSPWSEAKRAGWQKQRWDWHQPQVVAQQGPVAGAERPLHGLNLEGFSSLASHKRTPTDQMFQPEPRRPQQHQMFMPNPKPTAAWPAAPPYEPQLHPAAGARPEPHVLGQSHQQAHQAQHAVPDPRACALRMPVDIREHIARYNMPPWNRMGSDDPLILPSDMRQPQQPWHAWQLQPEMHQAQLSTESFRPPGLQPNYYLQGLHHIHGGGANSAPRRHP